MAQVVNMSTIPDDLDKLLGDVRKVIDDNRKFLKSLSGDAEVNAESEIDGDEAKEEDEFEEL
jgi:hypothetical protein